eukprot:469514_1
MIEQWIKNETIQPVCADSICPNVKCGGLYNGMVSTFVNMTVKAYIWWQGENNMGGTPGSWVNNTGYGCMQPFMLKQWRHIWSVVSGTSDVHTPFGLITLAAGTDEGAAYNMGAFRWAQTANFDYLPNMEMINTFVSLGHDMGEPWGSGCVNEKPVVCNISGQPYSLADTPQFMGPIHPRIKLPLGQRLAYAGYNILYGKSSDIKVVTGPVISGCVMDLISKQIVITFNNTFLNGEKVQVVEWSAWYNKSLSVENWSGMKVGYGTEWQFVNIWKSVENDNDVIVDITKFVDKNINITGLRYAYDTFPCCGDLDKNKYPCPPDQCPIKSFMSKTNVTLPAVPFWAQIINNKCQCFHPQICDGSDYIIPEINNNKFARIIPTPEPTLRPTRSPTIDTWIFNECNVIIQQNNITIHFKYSHKHMDIILSKPMITFIVNDLEIISTYNEIEYINLSKDEINSAIKNNKFESRLSFKDNYGYNINQKKIKCLYTTQSPTVLISSDNLTSVQPTVAPNIETIFINNKEMNDIIRANANKNIEIEEEKDKFAKPLSNLSVEELNFVLFEIITSDDKLNNAKIDINIMKEISIKQDLNGVKFKEMKRKDFGKLYKSSGMKGGPASK